MPAAHDAEAAVTPKMLPTDRPGAPPYLAALEQEPSDRHPVTNAAVSRATAAERLTPLVTLIRVASLLLTAAPRAAPVLSVTQLQSLRFRHASCLIQPAGGLKVPCHAALRAATLAGPCRAEGYAPTHDA
jgi:hypothetical protein